MLIRHSKIGLPTKRLKHKEANLSAGPRQHLLPDLESACMLTSSAVPGVTQTCCSQWLSSTIAVLGCHSRSQKRCTTSKWPSCCSRHQKLGGKTMARKCEGMQNEAAAPAMKSMLDEYNSVQCSRESLLPKPALKSTNQVHEQ